MNIDLKNLENKLILVVGVTGDIGYDLVLTLLQNEKIKVVGVSSGTKNRHKIQKLNKFKNFKSSYINLNKISSIENKCNKIRLIHGVPEIIINCAGIFKFKKLSKHTTKEIIEAKIFPPTVIGITSPYPTVASETVAHQIEAVILENTSG